MTFGKSGSSSRQHYIREVVFALRSLGGQASPSQVYAWLDREDRIRAVDRERTASEPGWFEREVRFARQELFLGGLITAPTRGIWMLSAEGQIAGLSDDEINRMMRHRQGKVVEDPARPIVTVTDINPASDFNLATGVATLGPKPTSWTGVITRTATKSSWTYVLQFADAEIWKIGHSNDLAIRLSDVNRHIPSEIIPGEWHIIFKKAWPCSLSAYEMEQSLLRLLASFRTVGERVRCSREVLEHCWQEALARTSLVVTGGAPETKTS